MEQLKNIDLPENVIKETIMLLDEVLQKEVTTFTNFKHTFIDEDGKEVKNPTPERIEKDSLQQVFDVSRTIYEPTFKSTITEKGVKIAQLKFFYEHKLKELEDSEKPELELVED